jgi:protein-S-isoprenylcysteine O-methyltransferase Ste14
MFKRKIKKLKGFFLNIILIWLVFFFYKSLPYYQNFLKQETYSIIFYLAISYTIIGFIYYFFASINKIKITKGQLIFSLFFKVLKLKLIQISKQEKISLLFILVKIFFLPIMLNFVINNFYAFQNQFSQLTIYSFFSIYGFNNLIFPFALTTIFFLDTLWFSFGYTFEAGFLNNTVRSVEPTLLGWAVALICYPPFNSFAVKYIDWFANDYRIFSDPLTTMIIRIIIILLLSIYVGATLALGTKCSNLTNRGIITRFPYSIVRHPAYISKNLAWWITIIPIASIPAVISMSAWSFIYHLRTITEEKHLSADPDYIEYKNKVKWKYIPGVY